jgi:hypothetical protein
MAKQTVKSQKRRGPAPTGKGEPVLVRFQPPQIAALDAWISKQANPLASRAEAIRRLVEQALVQSAPPRPRPKAESAKASALARQELEQVTDTAAPPEEQERRKRRLLKGPPEFREMRGDGGRRFKGK